MRYIVEHMKRKMAIPATKTALSATKITSHLLRMTSIYTAVRAEPSSLKEEAASPPDRTTLPSKAFERDQTRSNCSQHGNAEINPHSF